MASPQSVLSTLDARLGEQRQDLRLILSQHREQLPRNVADDLYALTGDIARAQQRIQDELAAKPAR